MRGVLLDEAHKNYMSLATQEQTEYSRALASMESRTNTQMSGSKFNKGVVVLDPFKFDIGMALGIAPEEVVRQNVAAKANPAETNPGVIGGAAGTMAGALKTPMGTTSYTQVPVAYSINYNPEPKVCVIVPETADTDPERIKEFTRVENQVFTNSHEAWHCRDDKYTEQLRKINVGKHTAVDYSSDIRDLPDHAGVRETYSLLHKKECLADVGTLGDMIREGKDPKIINDVARWRNHMSWEVKHFTTPVIEGLKQKIDEMGVENFRKLSEKDAQKLYYEVTDKYALDGNDIKNINTYEAGGALTRAFYKASTFVDGDFDRAMQFRARHLSEWTKAYEEDKMKNPPANSYSVNAPKPAAQQKAETALVQWDAAKALKDKAFATDHKITPATLVRAYGDMQDELCAKTRSDPANTVMYEEQMTRLKVALLGNMQSMDYVTENKRRGVTLENVEASLKGFAKPVPVAAGKAKVAAPSTP